MKTEKLHNCWCVTKRETGELEFEWTGSYSWMVHAVHILPKWKWSQHNAWGSDFVHPRPFIPHWRPSACTYTNSTVPARKQEYYVYPSSLELFSDTKDLVVSKHFPVSWCLCIYLFKWQVLYICFVLKEIFANSEMEWWLSWVTSLIMSGFDKNANYWNGYRDFHWGPMDFVLPLV